MKATANQSRIRVLLADDHLIVRQGIRSSFHNHALITIVGEAATGLEAIDATERLSPDVVLMDINMPEMNGLDATTAIRQKFPATKVLILTVHDTREYVVRVMQSGAQGYVLKNASPDELFCAINAVFLGHAFFSPQIASIVLDDFRSNPENGNRAVRLSGREAEVLQMIVKGRTTKEIARQMNVGARTVETYRARLMRKLKVRNAAELTSAAIARHLL